MKRGLLLSIVASLWLAAAPVSQTDTIQKHYYQSYHYEQLGKYDEAIKVLAPLYKKYANGYTLNLRLGWLFFQSKKYKDSLAYYQKASIINPYAINPRLGMIRIYLQTEAYKKAESASQELLKIDYYNYYANHYIVKALMAQKKYNVALTIVRKMLSLYPASVPYLEVLAQIYKATGNKYFKQVCHDILVLDPNNTMVCNLKK